MNAADSSKLVLHDYWRSGAAYRVRIALSWKNLDYVAVSHDLRTGAQRAAAYLAQNPQGLVPTLEREGLVLSQSSAILEWLEETYPKPALLPADAGGRAIVRAMAAAIGCDVHPLGNLRVQKQLRTQLAADDDAVRGWIAHWIEQGFAALEVLIARHGQGFAFGSTPTFADCYLVPQVYSAERFGVELGTYPRLRAAAERFRVLPAVVRAHPSQQPDADSR
jgi:maleylpyruvate isomerase